MRLTKITGVDLNVFDFDFDVTWAAFLMSADEKIYGRYGGRDASSADNRLSVEGLKFAMRQALDVHRLAPKDKAPSKEKPLLAEEYPAAKRRKGKECIHCHQVSEFRRDLLKSTGTWQRDSLWVYPLPENLGITLEVDQGNRLRAVVADSPAGKLGLKSGDILQTLHGLRIASFADAQYALHRAPAKGRLSLSWQRDNQTHSGDIELPEGWRKTNVTWRPSMLDILPSLAVHGDDLSLSEKKTLGLSEKQLAFRQEKPILGEAKRLGIQENDVIVGIDNQFFEMTVLQFQAHVRRNYLVGERTTLNILRDGKKIDLPMTLR